MEQTAHSSVSHGRPTSADPTHTPPSPSSALPGAPSPAHKRNTSGGGGGGGGLLSKFPFMRSTADQRSARHDADEDSSAPRPATSISTALQQQKTRRRRGSLRKVALLGRGAQRERREATPLTIDTKHAEEFGIMGSGMTSSPQVEGDVYGLGISDITPRPSMDGYASRTAQVKSPPEVPAPPTASKVDEPVPTSPTISYSTTDDEDVLHIAPHTPSPLRPELSSLSSGSESYFSNRMNTLQPRRSISRAKSPLALTGLTTTPIPPPDPDWDYAETEWWGWVVLVVTWFVFVTGMGSCLGVWSWAWDVGTTPYAPPELEDDPTLPIVGYYPALIILTCVMAWVWVIIAWIGMKYFRHAKISGD